MMTQEVAFQCLDSWGRAVAKKDKSGVLNHYIDSATLWPTLSNELRQGPDRISDYFDHFLPKINGDVDGINVVSSPYQIQSVFGLAFIHSI